MKARIAVSLVCIAANLIASAVSFAQSDSQFSKANQEFASGHFKDAIAAYEQLVYANQWSANLFYNLGNAYFRAGDVGHAILNYERALALDRHHPEAQANLQIARDEARALELTPAGAERFAQFADSNQYAIVAAIAFWIGLFCFAAWMFERRRSNGKLVLAILCLLIFALTAAAIVVLENGGRGGGFAVVTGNGVEARLATADNARSVLALPAGSEIKILSKRGDWIFAALPNNLRGWITAKSAEPVRL
jgi:hypothetical protein